MPDPRITIDPTSGATERAPEVPAANARALARWWARGANGVLRVESDAGGDMQSALVLLAGGGPVGDDGMDGIRLALSGGALAFDPMDADEPGARDELAELLWAAARAAAHLDAVQPALVLLATASPGLLDAPMDARLAAAIVELKEPTALADLARALDADVRALCDELAVTTWLGLTTLKAPHAVHERRTQPPPPALVVAPSTFSEGPREPVASREAELARPESRTTLGTTAPIPTRELPPRDRAEPSPIHRLRREAELLRHSDGWTALGIPRGSPPEMIAAAAARMRQRYQPLQRDPNPDAREYGSEILRRVSEAERSLSGGGSGPDPEVADQTAAGGVALERGDFARADRHFAAARRLAPNDASVLAHLAWARFKNPEHKRPAREDEAQEFIALALQFDAESAVTWRYKGEIARARGELEAAKTALQTAARLSRR